MYTGFFFQEYISSVQTELKNLQAIADEDL